MVATSSAMRSGLLSGSTCTAVPTWSRRVRAAMNEASISGADCTGSPPLKWTSPSHTQSRPQASAASASASVSRYVAVSETPRRRSSRKMPKCMGRAPRQQPARSRASAKRR